MNQSLSVHAVDVGYGNTKLITNTMPNGSFEKMLFPSLAFPAVKTDLGEGILSKRDTVRVYAGDSIYEVGPDVEMAATSNGVTRVLHQHYIDTDQYLSLLRGALAYIDKPVVDILVVGLPVSLMQSKQDALRNRLIGTHEYPERPPVHVKNVIVLAQPLGGFVDHIKREQNYETIREKQCLLIDPGYYTLDWMVAKGMKEIPGLSGSSTYGMSVALRTIAEILSNDLGVVYENLTKIDGGLRTGDFRIYGKPYDLGPCLESAVSRVMPGITQLANMVGKTEEIDSVFVVGGASHFFSTLLHDALPHHEVLTVDDPVFANVRGFQWIGISAGKSQSAIAAA